MTEAPAQALEAELAVLGSMLIEQQAARRAVLHLDSEDFYQDSHRVIFRAINQLIDDGAADIDVVVVGQYLKILGAGSYMDVLTGAVNMAVTAAHVDSYCRIVKEASLKRQFDIQVKRTADDPSPENTEKLTDLSLRMNGQAVGTIFSFQDSMHEMVEQILSNPIEGFQTGFFDLDNSLVQLDPGDLTVIGARTSGGKTVMATSIMLNMARAGVRCLYCTSEMKDIQLVKRFLPSITKIEAFRFRSGKLDDSEKDAVRQAAAEHLQPLPAHIMGRSRLSLKDIRGAAIKTKAQVVFVDYLQRCTMPRAESRNYEIEAFMVQIKSLAQEASVHVILLAQLDRQGDKNPTVPPTLADLRGSGAIEHEADQVLLLWRPPDTVVAKRSDWVPPQPGNVAIEGLIKKGRHGGADQVVNLELNGNMVMIAERTMNTREGEKSKEEWWQL